MFPNNWLKCRDIYEPCCIYFFFFLSQIDNIGFQVNLVKGIFVVLLRDNNRKIDKKNWQKINSHGKKYIRFKWIRLGTVSYDSICEKRFPTIFEKI